MRPVRYGLRFYILCKINSVFKGLTSTILITSFDAMLVICNIFPKVTSLKSTSLYQGKWRIKSR
jgi:hypothetical protein